MRVGNRFQRALQNHLLASSHSIELDKMSLSMMKLRRMTTFRPKSTSPILTPMKSLRTTETGLVSKTSEELK